MLKEIRFDGIEWILLAQKRNLLGGGEIVLFRVLWKSANVLTS